MRCATPFPLPKKRRHSQDTCLTGLFLTPVSLISGIAHRCVVYRLVPLLVFDLHETRSEHSRRTKFVRAALRQGFAFAWRTRRRPPSKRFDGPPLAARAAQQLTPAWKTDTTEQASALDTVANGAFKNRYKEAPETLSAVAREFAETESGLCGSTCKTHSKPSATETLVGCTAALRFQKGHRKQLRASGVFRTVFVSHRCLSRGSL